MADDFDMRFHEETSGSYILPNMRMLSFESETSHNSINVNPTMTGYVNMESLGSISVSNVSGLQRAPGVDDDIGPISHVGSSSINSWGDPVADVHEESGLTSEWTVEEELILKQGLIEYAGVHGTMKYVKIAYMLDQKTVRDVALRCRWLSENRKLYMLESHFAGKNKLNKKDKAIDSGSCMNSHITPPEITASNSQMMHQGTRFDQLSSQVPIMDIATQQLMDENSQIFLQIVSNLVSYKVKENIELLHHACNNISAIQTNMSCTPGIMGQMPPLPVVANKELLNVLVSTQNQLFTLPPNVTGIFSDEQPGMDLL